LLALLGILLLSLVVRERYDPFLVLFLDDLLHPKSSPLTVSLSSRLALRLYQDTRPHIGKVASLQKGLVLVQQDEELIEEGYGFGFPVVVVDGAAHVSRHASTWLVQEEGQTTLVKSYAIDVQDQPTRLLREKFKDIPPLGRVVVSYTLLSPTQIVLDADLSGLGPNWDRMYLMNEQGAVAFPTYQDEERRIWSGEQVGIWRPSDAPINCWLSGEETLRFCVETEAGRRKFVGQERRIVPRWTGFFYLSWSGVDIEIEPPTTRYQYLIRVEEQR
jgi:hypothetical protein